MIRSTLTVLTTLVIACVFAGSAAYANVLIDWSAANDISGSADANGNWWNTLGPGGVGDNADFAATALTASDNTASGWSVAADLTGDGSNWTGAGFGGTAIDGPTGANPFDITGTDRPTVDGMYANYNANGTAVITFTGLSASTQYDFSAIGGRASGGNNGYIKVITGTPGSGGADIDLLETTGGTGKYADDDLLDTFSLLNDGTVASFSVTSDSSGSIAFDFFEGQNDTDGGTSATWNAVSIAVIPEPASLGLFGIVCGMLWFVRRRLRG